MRLSLLLPPSAQSSSSSLFGTFLLVLLGSALFTVEAGTGNTLDPTATPIDTGSPTTAPSSTTAEENSSSSSSSSSATTKTEEVIAGTCQCQPLGPPDDESYIVTRLWTIVDPESTTDQDVIDAFNDGFAPMVTSMPGFQRYTAATTGNESTVFFMNAFDTAENAKAAQAAAFDFVKGSSLLNGAIEPYQFTEDEAIYGFPSTSDVCITEPSVGQYLSTREFRWTEPDDITTEQLVAAGTSFNDRVKDLDGYVTYVGTLSLDKEVTFVYNIYTSEESAEEANSMGTDNAATNTAEVPPNELVAETEGMIIFDYLCADPSLLPDPEATSDGWTMLPSSRYYFTDAIQLSLFVIATLFSAAVAAF